MQWHLVVKCLVIDAGFEPVLAPELRLGERIRELAESFFLGRHRAAFFAPQARLCACGQNARADVDEKFWWNRHGC